MHGKTLDLHITAINPDISATFWNDFNLTDGSYSIIICIIKKYETIADNPPVQIYTNKIKNRIVFKIKAESKLELLSYKLELEFSETMKLLRSTKKKLIKIKMEKIYLIQLINFFSAL